MQDNDLRALLETEVPRSLTDGEDGVALGTEVAARLNRLLEAAEQVDEPDAAVAHLAAPEPPITGISVHWQLSDSVQLLGVFFRDWEGPEGQELSAAWTVVANSQDRPVIAVVSDGVAEAINGMLDVTMIDWTGYKELDAMLRPIELSDGSEAEEYWHSMTQFDESAGEWVRTEWRWKEHEEAPSFLEGGVVVSEDPE